MAVFIEASSTPEQQILFNLVGSISKGEILVYPTETIHGFGCDYRNYSSIEALNELKGRTKEQPFLLLASSWSQLEYIVKMPEKHEVLLKEFWPGPLTALLPVLDAPEWMCCNNKVGVRITKHPFAKSLIDYYGFPLVSTSINKTKHDPIKNMKKLDEEFSTCRAWSKVKYICEDIALKETQRSTIVDLSTDKIKLIREGEIPFDTIKQFQG